MCCIMGGGGQTIEAQIRKDKRILAMAGIDPITLQFPYLEGKGHQPQKVLPAPPFQPQYLNILYSEHSPKRAPVERVYLIYYL